MYNLSDLDITAGSSENGGVAMYAYGVFTDLNDGFPQENGFVYYDGGDAVTILDYTERTYDLVFPDKINGKNYVIADYAFGWKDFDSLTFGAGLTEIGECAFYRNVNLKSVVLPKSLTKLGKSSFDYCYALEFVDLGGVEEIGAFAFDYDYALKEIVMHENLRIIGYDAFSNCDFTELYFPDSVTEIDWGAFSENKNLTEVSIPSTAMWNYKYSFPEDCTVTVRREQN